MQTVVAEHMRHEARRANQSVSVLRHCEERSDEAIHSFTVWPNGLLRFARNDE